MVITWNTLGKVFDHQMWNDFFQLEATEAFAVCLVRQGAYWWQVFLPGVAETVGEPLQWLTIPDHMARMLVAEFSS
ncbi:MAG: hypothetical protein GXX09_00400 [Syntrophomonadaceae bacterium]|nr:hypothetical protein [Syntrophomonadaceae bacterium]